MCPWTDRLPDCRLAGSNPRTHTTSQPAPSPAYRNVATPRFPATQNQIRNRKQRYILTRMGSVGNGRASQPVWKPLFTKDTISRQEAPENRRSRCWSRTADGMRARVTRSANIGNSVRDDYGVEALRIGGSDSSCAYPCTRKFRAHKAVGGGWRYLCATVALIRRPSKAALRCLPDTER